MYPDNTTQPKVLLFLQQPPAMATSDDDNPPQRTKPGPPKNSWWSKVGYKLVKPAKGQFLSISLKLASDHKLYFVSGKHSGRTDERCFTYCSQSVVGRVEKREP